MDAQQQVVALLESELQKTILGGTSTTVKGLLEKGSLGTVAVAASGTAGTTGYVAPVAAVDATDGGAIYQIYKAAGVAADDKYVDNFNPADQWLDAMSNAATDPLGGSSDASIDQDGLRQMLYQARALLGELRIEEQAWNGEVNSEKTLRKEVNDFAKV
jgi:hypothetical protein